MFANNGIDQLLRLRPAQQTLERAADGGKAKQSPGNDQRFLPPREIRLRLTHQRDRQAAKLTQTGVCRS